MWIIEATPFQKRKLKVAISEKSFAPKLDFRDLNELFILPVPALLLLLASEGSSKELHHLRCRSTKTTI